MDSMMMHSDDGGFDISSIAMYQPFEGLLEVRVVCVCCYDDENQEKESSLYLLCF